MEEGSNKLYLIQGQNAEGSYIVSELHRSDQSQGQIRPFSMDCSIYFCDKSLKASEFSRLAENCSSWAIWHNLIAQGRIVSW